ncbi:MAG TPA: hypothetical protein EYG93_09365 [Sulfurospirillum arcachonense]|nr:hypothetical protein [Sulfurospirillum arcachonense]HIP45519.1 hypothetical protein [Sulfurospirillum arcachonense]
MRIIFIILLHVTLFATSYDFDEIKFVNAVGTDFKQSGMIEVLNDRTIITYTEPRFKEIIKTDNNITIKGKSGDVYTLKGKALFYTNLFIGVMTRLGNFNELKANSDFEVQKEKNMYYLRFKGDIADSIIRAEVTTKNSKVLSFKMFMPNEDRLEIIKK